MATSKVRNRQLRSLLFIVVLLFLSVRNFRHASWVDSSIISHEDDIGELPLQEVLHNDNEDDADDVSMVMNSSRADRKTLVATTNSSNPIGSRTHNPHSAMIAASSNYNNSTKQKQKEKNSTQRTLPKKRRKMVFMHVGKTGGETLRRHVFQFSCRLIFNEQERTKCLRDVGKESVLSSVTRGICHQKHSWPTPKYVQRATDYLFTVREPIARFESWYRYSHPNNCILQPAQKEGGGGVAMNIDGCKAKRRSILQGPASFSARFWKCFPSIESMAEALDDPAYSSSSSYPPDSIIHNATDCIELVRFAFLFVGVTDLFHLTANYRYYSQMAGLEEHPDHKTVWVVRTDHLWSDAERIDKRLGGQGNFSHTQNVRYSHGSESFRDKRGLKKDANLDRICCALWPEMVAYRSIMDRAANLNDAERIESYTLTWKRCNVTSWELLEDRCREKTKTIMNLS
jgi:hypothetical protein